MLKGFHNRRQYNELFLTVLINNLENIVAMGRRCETFENGMKNVSK